MNRVVGIETEYGCLITGDQSHGNLDAWPAQVKNHLFARVSRRDRLIIAITGHRERRILLNGGRLYIDMGHLEYSSPNAAAAHAGL
jgi:proteasome accessory factor A